MWTEAAAAAGADTSAGRLMRERAIAQRGDLVARIVEGLQQPGIDVGLDPDRLQHQHSRAPSMP
jgi:hypothetical protein